MSDALTMTPIDSRENPNAPPRNPQQFTNIAPEHKGAVYNGLSAGAKAFAREYLPEDDDKGRQAFFETVQEFKPFKSGILRDQAVEAGREPGGECDIFEPVIYIRITIPGNDKTIVHRPANAQDKTLFPFAWQQFLLGQQNVSHGTPLEQLGIDGALILGFHAKNIFTIEDLAVVSDNLLPNIGVGARELRQKAIGFVEKGKYSKAASTSNEVVEMKTTLAEQARQLSKAMALLEKQAEENETLRQQLTAKKKPGRPKAIAIEA